MSDEPRRQFVDTNILVYAHDESAGIKQGQAKSILRSLWESSGGRLSIQVLQEFYVTVTQKVAKPLSTTAASQIISDLGSWQVHRPDVEDVLRAIQIQTRYKTSFWDAMILQSAAQLECEILWSEDLNPGQWYGQVRVVNPFAR
jgi:predicted nucleic acid-binding protein